MVERSSSEKEQVMMKLARQVPLGKVGEPDDVAYSFIFSQ